MQIDITDFFRGEEAADYSASAFELGEQAGRITWRNAVGQGEQSPLLTTPEAIEALRAYVKGYGAWSEEEIEAWSDTECNALFIQMISCDIREIEALCADDNGEIDWTEAREMSDAGLIGGRIYPGDVPGSESFGRIFYYLGD